MLEIIKKTTLGGLMAAGTLLVVSLGQWQWLLTAKIQWLWLGSLVASAFQPAYHPLKGVNADEDRGSTLQILWTVYLSQALALIEMIYGRGPAALAWSGWSVVFLVLAWAGIFWRSWSYLTLGRFFTMHIQVHAGHKVVQSGPYRWMRHPSYTGAWLTYVAFPLFLNAPASAFLAAVFLFFAFQRRIHLEESILLRDLGEEYAQFCLTRKKLFPGIW